VGAAVVVQEAVGVGEAVPEGDVGLVVAEVGSLVVDPEGHAAVVVEDDGVGAVVEEAEVVSDGAVVVVVVVAADEVVLVVVGPVVVVEEVALVEEVELVAEVLADVVAVVVGLPVHVRVAVLGVSDGVPAPVVGLVAGRAEDDAAVVGAGSAVPDGGPTNRAAATEGPAPTSVEPSAPGVIRGTRASTVARYAAEWLYDRIAARRSVGAARSRPPAQR
jgi:hypothetical protein